MKYLIVEDREELQDALADELRKSPTTKDVLVASSGEEALTVLQKNPDIGMVVLDLNLELGGGEMYGMTVLSTIRTTTTILPVVIQTVDTAPERQIEALSKGATGFIDKNLFSSPIQIRNYLETIIQRVGPEAESGSGYYSFQGWTFDAIHRRLLNPNGAEVILQNREAELLLILVENPMSVLTYESLIEQLGIAGAKPKGAIKQLESRLKRKIDADRPNSLILGVHGKGIYFTPAVLSVARP